MIKNMNIEMSHLTERFEANRRIVVGGIQASD